MTREPQTGRGSEAAEYSQTIPAAQMRRQKRPCVECPWRLDVAPGQFPASRYDELRETAGGQQGLEGIAAPLFGCHLAPDDDPAGFACAGWLAVCGREHLGVRLAAAQGRLPVEALSPGVDWPGLHASYDEMARAQGAQ